MKKVLFVVNNPAFFISHRLNIAQQASEQGYEVAVASMAGSAVEAIKGYGYQYFELPMSRSGTNPLTELKTIRFLWALFRSYRPDVVHLVTIKPVLYGGLAARLARVPAVVYAIAGLGYLFTRKKKIDFVRWSVTVLYRLALAHRHSRVIVQNKSDARILRRMGAVKNPEQLVLIRGSGVNIEKFYPVPEPEGEIVITMASRLLKDKGVREYMKAATISESFGRKMKWQLAGSIDEGNPASVTQEEIDKSKAPVVLLGEVSDINQLYGQSHIVVLPSYREGLPKSLTEAAACGRAVVTTNVPGCRTAIIAGETGLLVPPRNANALYLAVSQLADDAPRRQAMGRAGRQLALDEFDDRVIAKKQVALYETLLTKQ